MTLQKMKHAAAAFVVLFGGAATAQATILQPGDVMIMGANTANPDMISVVALVDLQIGDSFSITDSGWKADNSGFRNTEGVLTYTATGAVPAGTVLSYINTGTISSGFSSNAPTNFSLNASNESLIVYTGTI